MPDDRSLTDFFDDEMREGAEEREGDGDAAATAADPDDDAVAPADVTYEWSDDETPCQDCGDPTRRRWRDARDGATVFVCAECKDW